VRRTRGHGRVLQEPQASQVPLGLLELELVIGIPCFEQKELADDLRAGLEVNGVGRPVEPALGRLFGREDVQALDPDLSDAEGFLSGRGVRQSDGQEERPDRAPLQRITRSPDHAVG